MANLTINNEYDLDQAKKLLDDMTAVSRITSTTSHRWDHAWCELIRDLEREIDRAERATFHVSDWMTAVPEGWDTVVGYLARNKPDVLRTMDATPSASLPDGTTLTRVMESQGFERGHLPKVRAPKALRDQGVPRVNIYPTPVLARHFAA